MRHAYRALHVNGVYQHRGSVEAYVNVVGLAYPSGWDSSPQDGVVLFISRNGPVHGQEDNVRYLPVMDFLDQYVMRMRGNSTIGLSLPVAQPLEEPQDAIFP